MASRLAPFVLALSLASSAAAQTGGAGGTGGGTAGLGSCSGMLAGSVGLAVDVNGTLQSVQAASVPYVFDNAECACTPTDPMQQVNLQIRLTTALPLNTPGTVEVWVGTGCDNYSTRSTPNQTQCQKLSSGIPNVTELSTGSNVNGLITIPIPGDALASPQPNGGTHVCTTATTSNNVYLFVYTDASMPFATCMLNLTEQNQGPAAVQPPFIASSGDGAVNLSWANPPQNTFTPKQYQVLCADENGNPILSSPPAPQYSTCINGVLRRRSIGTGGTTPTGGSDAGTTTTTFDLAPSLLPQAPPGSAPQPEVIPWATADMGGSDMASRGDMAGVSPIWNTDGGLGPLADLDPRFVCTATISPASTTARITGLTNYKRYHFVVLSIDAYGNATPSAATLGIPQPVEDLYRRYRDEGGAAGGCFIATAAFGSYENSWVKVLRDFRDEVMLPTSIGHDMVEWYYAHSPPAAAWIARHPVARVVVRVLLVPVIVIAGAWVYSTPWQKALALLLVLAWLFRRRLRAAWRGGAA